MCIVIHKPKGICVKKEIYENCFTNNPDGAGFIIREKTGELVMEKGFFTFKDFWEHFHPHQAKKAVIHFRIRTHGEIDVENCHPLWVKENSLAFAHNGVISNVDTSKQNKMSDTWHFNTSILQHLQDKMGEEFIFDTVIQELINEYIGYSKLVFLHQDGRTLIFNKSTGVEENGVWYSNYTFRSWKPAKHNKKHTWTKQYTNTSSEWIPRPGTVNQFMKNLNYVPPITTDLVPVKSNLVPIVRPPMRSGPPLSSTIRINDYIEMIQPWRDLKGNEVGVVIAIYGDRTAEIKIFDSAYPTGWKIRTLPYSVFQTYTPEKENRDFEKESKLITLTKNKPIEGEVLSRDNTPDMSQVTKVGQTLEESACNEVYEQFRENYLH